MNTIFKYNANAKYSTKDLKGYNSNKKKKRKKRTKVKKDHP